MPDTLDSSLAEQVKQASQAAVADARKHTLPTQGANDQAGGQSEQDVKLPEYMKGTGIDERWSSLPAETRQSLAKWGKNLYDGFQAKTAEVSEVRTLKEQLESDPERFAFIKDKLDEFEDRRSGKAEASPVTKQEKETVTDLIEELKDSDDPTVRKQAQRLEEAIQKRIVVPKEVRSELDAMKVLLKHFTLQATNQRKTVVSEELDKLGQAWTPVLEKHRELLLKKSVLEPEKSVKRLLMDTLSPEEYETAVRAEASVEPKRETSRAKEAFLPNRPAEGVSSNGEGVFKGAMIPSKNPRAYGDKVHWGKVISNILPLVKKELPR